MLKSWDGQLFRREGSRRFSILEMAKYVSIPLFSKLVRYVGRPDFRCEELAGYSRG
jgi:hypothetical protein